MDANTAQLGISIERGSEPIAGKVRQPDGTSAPFHGYVQLIAVIERVHVGEQADNGRPGKPNE
jgi:hypothetical protein